MEAQNSRSIIAEIDAHMRKSGIANSSWYVGITSDVDERLFGFHQVPKKNHWFIYRLANNANEARATEAAYHSAGCKGAGGGGDSAAVYVYAYVITARTVE